MVGSPSVPKPVPWAAWSGLAVWLLWFPLLALRGIDPDELEHLHAAFCVWRGDLPYRDFFEHHAPALYWLAWPLFIVHGPHLGTLWWLRGVMWLCTGCTALLISRPRHLGRPDSPVSGDLHPHTPRPNPHERATVSPLQAVAATPSSSAHVSLGSDGNPPHRGSIPPVGLASLLWLGTTIAVSKGIEFRPDVPATTLLAGVMLLATSGSAHLPTLRVVSTGTVPHAGRAFQLGWLGLCSGLATLFTQKAIVPLAALTAVLLLRAGMAHRDRRDALTALAIPLGVLGTWLLTGLGFAAVGAGSVFWDSTIAQLWRWSLRSGTWAHLRPTLLADGWFWGLAALGTIAALRRQPRPPGDADAPPVGDDPRPIVAGAALLCGLSLWLVKATFPQYYLLWFPWLALPAAEGWQIVTHWGKSTPARAPAPLANPPLAAATGHLGTDLGTGPSANVWTGSGRSFGAAPVAPTEDEPHTPGTIADADWAGRVATADGGSRGLEGWLPVGVLLLAAMASLAGLARGLVQGSAGSLFALFQSSPTRFVALGWGVVAALGLLALGARVRPRWLGLLLAISLLQGVARQANLLAWSNRTQVEAIAAVQALVPEQGRILDGFTGWGALRPHAWHHWWLNEFSLALIPPDQLEAELLGLLSDSPPAAILDDAELQRLPPRVRQTIEQNYRPVTPVPLRLHSPGWNRSPDR